MVRTTFIPSCRLEVVKDIGKVWGPTAFMITFPQRIHLFKGHLLKGLSPNRALSGLKYFCLSGKGLRRPSVCEDIDHCRSFKGLPFLFVGFLISKVLLQIHTFTTLTLLFAHFLIQYFYVHWRWKLNLFFLHALF